MLVLLIYKFNEFEHPAASMLAWLSGIIWGHCMLCRLFVMYNYQDDHFWMMGKLLEEPKQEQSQESYISEMCSKKR
jgi:hypothetical protein